MMEVSHEARHSTFHFSLDSHRLCHSHHRLYLQSVRQNSTIRFPDPVCICSHNGPLGALDVERPCRSPTHLEKDGAARRFCSAMKMGDKVKIIDFSPYLTDDRVLNSKSAFEKYLGNVVRVRSFENDWLELGVSKVTDNRFWEPFESNRTAQNR